MGCFRRRLTQMRVAMMKLKTNHPVVSMGCLVRESLGKINVGAYYNRKIS